MRDPGLATQLQSGLQSLKIEVPAAQQEALLAYLDLLSTWNKSYNLTAIRDPCDMVPQHLLDALVALPYINAGPVLDVGSGAGLPGIPLAIVRPQLGFTLLDSNGKKIRFIKQVVIALQLTNVDVVQSRVEEYQPAMRYPLIVSRAFSSLEQFIRLTSHLLAPGGEWLAWKGHMAPTELSQVGAEVEIRQCIPVELPTISAERQLVRVGNKSD